MVLLAVLLALPDFEDVTVLRVLLRCSNLRWLDLRVDYRLLPLCSVGVMTSPHHVRETDLVRNVLFHAGGGRGALPFKASCCIHAFSVQSHCLLVWGGAAARLRRLVVGSVHFLDVRVDIGCLDLLI